MRSAIAGVLLLAAAAGCATSPPADMAVPMDCQFPNVDPGSNAYLVGVVRQGSGDVLSQVDARAEPIGGEASVVTDSTNDSGCFFLSFEPGLHYRVTFTRPGFETQTLADESVAAGGKTVRAIMMSSV